jgi:3-hydroxybutyryl-CoA dehydratase
MTTTGTEAGRRVVDFPAGAEFTGPARTMTTERTGWYSMGMLAGGTGERQPVQHNIHTDPEYARQQGLPTAIADGMHSTNWISALLAEHFGTHYIARGSLRTKYIKPVLVGVVITPRAVVSSREDLSDEGVRYRLEVWCEDQDGIRLTVGEAAIVVAA